VNLNRRRRPNNTLHQSELRERTAEWRSSRGRAHANFVLLTVEIPYLAGLHGRKSKRKSRPIGIDEIEINNGGQQSLERLDQIHRGPLDADFGINAPREPW
jgi:hypothetical protein